MAEYIEREALLKEDFTNMFVDPYDIEIFEGIIEKAPTADVVKVIRCKGCGYCELCYPAKAIGEEAIEGYFCRINKKYLTPTDYCSYGIKRGEDNDT